MGQLSTAPAQRSLTPLQKGILALLVLVLVGSLVLRVTLGAQQAAPGSAPAGAQGLSAAQSGEPAPEPGPLDAALPYVTEGSLFGLIGFALGYSTRKVFKLALILIALAFVGVQALVHLGWVEIDWGGLAGKLNAWLFNLRESAGPQSFLFDRVPSVGALIAGWVVGFRRG